MPEVATVTSKSMVNIPAKIRRKYRLEAGSKVLFVESDGQIMRCPSPPLHHSSASTGSIRMRYSRVFESLRKSTAANPEND